MYKLRQDKLNQVPKLLEAFLIFDQEGIRANLLETRT